MKHSRRDFLKFMGVLAATVVVPSLPAAKTPRVPGLDGLEPIESTIGTMGGRSRVPLTQWQKWVYEAYEALNPQYPDWPTNDRRVRFEAPADIFNPRIIRMGLDVHLGDHSGVSPDKRRMHVGMEILRQELEDLGIDNETRFKECVTWKLQDMIGYFTTRVDAAIAA